MVMEQPDRYESAIHTMLIERMVEDEIREADYPHIVICRDVESGHVWFQGPYPDGMAAVLAVEREVRANGGPTSDLSYAVAPLQAGLT